MTNEQHVGNKGIGTYYGQDYRPCVLLLTEHVGDFG